MTFHKLITWLNKAQPWPVALLGILIIAAVTFAAVLLAAVLLW
jgi:hypothetical protein